MATLNYYSYDAATGICQHQTQTQFHDSLTADIQRALDAGCLDTKAKSFREIQAEEEAKAMYVRQEAYSKNRPTPQHGLAAFLDVSGGLQAPPAPPAKKKTMKPVVEKFSLDEI
jgi:hypothetical protein